MRTFLYHTTYLMVTTLVMLAGCNPPWDDHYGNQEETVNMKIWDAIRENPEYSTFISLIESNGLDSIFQVDQVNTLFIPTNEAFQAAQDTGIAIETLLQYHIIPSLFIDQSVLTWRKILTLSGKYVIVERLDAGYSYNEIPMGTGSPLYLDGKYYELPQVAAPLPNLYEYTSQISDVLKVYIDSKDSVFLDRSLSTPIGFDEDGNTIYDSVFGVVNLFEEEFFPVSEEFRDRTATMLLFSQDQYNMALDDMAARLGGDIVDHEDIPFSWQDEVLLPAFTRGAMFDGIISYSDLQKGRVKSITGDTVVVEAEKIDPDSRTLCSNGAAYHYSEFAIHDTLFRGTAAREGETMIRKIGVARWTWTEDVTTTGGVFEPKELPAAAASGGFLVSVNLGTNYQGDYEMEFKFKNLFPMRYRLEWRASSRPSGVYEVYVNDSILTYEDKFGNVHTDFDLSDLKYSVVSVTGERFLSEQGFNMRDYWVESITEYGDVTVRFKYLESGESSTNGFNIDYIKLIPDF